MGLLPCLIPGCKHIFKNKSGQTKHMCMLHPRPLRNHRKFHQAAPAPLCSPSPERHNEDDALHLDKNGPGDSFMPDADTYVKFCTICSFKSDVLAGLKCNINGDSIDQNSPPPLRTDTLPTDWTPYESRVAFETAEFLFTRNQMSAGQIDTLLDLWAATLIQYNDSPPFASHHDLYDTIDSTPLGDIAWESFSMSYKGVKPAENVPPWMKATYEVWFRDPRLLIHNILTNPDFDGEIEYTPYRDYDDNNQRCFKNFFSSDWAWKQADKIAEDPEMHGSTFVPLIVGSDKTMVSVATGHTEYHPLYLSIGNVFNSVRRAHRNSLVLVGFLMIPTTTKEHADDVDFQNFRRQLFHSSLANIFKSLKKNMTTPDIQVLLSGIVMGWCLKCLNNRNALDGDGLLWCQEHTDLLIQELQHKQLWYEYSIVGDVVPFTNDFARADIHELLSPDLLHQIIKGTFKDHLVDWVGEYLEHTHGKARAAEIQDDIDQRIAAVAPFAGFSQWTGDDSKALMKVYLPAIRGHVPQDIIRAFSAFLDFCYIVRCEALMEDDLVQLQDALDRFHQYHEVFKTTGVRLTFSLPCQHSLQHYARMIRLFGAPNGLCSSITESKHIKAVKEPWRRSSRYKALGQMLLTNQRLDKIAAARSDFEARGMLHRSCVSDALQMLKNVLGGARDVPTLALALGLPEFPTMIQQFLYNQLHLTDREHAAFDPATAPAFMGRILIYSSVAASFYAPSDLSGTGGMRREHIRATTSWRGGPARNDCVFISMNDEVSCGLDGLAVARVSCFFSLKYRAKYLQCAVVQWFSYVTDSRDPDTGMYIVAPSTNDNGTPDVSIIHIDCIFRAAHLIPVYGNNFIPREITLHNSHNMFHAFYINKYADHHAFEVGQHAALLPGPKYYCLFTPNPLDTHFTTPPFVFGMQVKPPHFIAYILLRTSLCLQHASKTPTFHCLYSFVHLPLSLAHK
ncbi:hypothetical protein F4604DRAFT_1877832 [Suillus subluteus]|nr:hypothetical protein F4604DRAFT_1877832 [Suillus subluteus]